MLRHSSCRAACASGQGIHFPGLAHVPVLAEFAGQITAGGAEGQHRRTGQKVIERFFFDGVHAEPAGTSIGLEHHARALAPAHEAQSPLPIPQLAGARAHIALHPAVGQGMPVAGGDRVGWVFVQVFHGIEPEGERL
jgi:hypothetical protein